MRVTDGKRTIEITMPMIRDMGVDVADAMLVDDSYKWDEVFERYDVSDVQDVIDYAESLMKDYDDELRLYIRDVEQLEVHYGEWPVNGREESWWIEEPRDYEGGRAAINKVRALIPDDKVDDDHAIWVEIDDGEMLVFDDERLFWTIK